MTHDPSPTPPKTASPSTSLLGHTTQELETLVQQHGERPYRGRQLFEAMHRLGATDLSSLKVLPSALREQLAQSTNFARPHIEQVQVSRDGTRKFQFRSADNSYFEAVYIPEVAKYRRTNTLCVSSQTGCSVGCTFCYTASIRRNRDLTAAEIVGQVHAVRDHLQTTTTLRDTLPEDPMPTNVVYMGMGEPLLNFDHVVRSARILIAPNGLDFSSRRVTISTAGIVPRIVELGQELPCQLAISLNATTDAVRNQIMPINRKWPLKKLIAALHAYPIANRRRFTIEYVLLGGLNDSLDDARRLPQLLAGLPVTVNLLPLNPHSETKHIPPTAKRVAEFQRILLDHGMNTFVRTQRGDDIAAACGQLGGPNQPETAVHQPAPPAAHARLPLVSHTASA